MRKVTLSDSTKSKLKKNDEEYDKAVDSFLGRRSNAISRSRQPLQYGLLQNDAGWNSFRKENKLSHFGEDTQKAWEDFYENNYYSFRGKDGTVTPIKVSQAGNYFLDKNGDLVVRPLAYTEGEKAGWVNMTPEQVNAASDKRQKEIREFNVAYQRGDYKSLFGGKDFKQSTQDQIDALKKDQDEYNARTNAAFSEAKTFRDEYRDKWHQRGAYNPLAAAYQDATGKSYNAEVVKRYNNMFGANLDPESFDYHNLPEEDLEALYNDKGFRDFEYSIYDRSPNYFSDDYVYGKRVQDARETLNAYNEKQNGYISELQKRLTDAEAYDQFMQQYSYEGTYDYDPSKDVITNSPLGLGIGADDADRIYYWLGKKDFDYEDAGNNLGLDYGSIAFMTDAERQEAIDYYVNGDKKGMMAFVDGLMPYLKQAREDFKQNNTTLFADVMPVTSSAMSVFTNLAGGVAGIGKAGYDIINKAIDSNYVASSEGIAGDLSHATQTIRGEVSQNLDSLGKINLPLVGEKGFGDIYNATMSAIDSYVGRKIGMSLGKSEDAVKYLSLGVMGLEAFNATYTNSLDEGMDQNTALLRAVTESSIEVLTEIFSFDEIMKDPAEVQGFLKQFFRVYGAEVSEEMIGALASPLLEYVETGENDYTRMYKELLADETTMPEEARKMVAQQFGQDLLSPVFDMFFSTGPEMVLQHGAQYVNDRRTGKKLNSRGNISMPNSEPVIAGTVSNKNETNVAEEQKAPEVKAVEEAAANQGADLENLTEEEKEQVVETATEAVEDAQDKESSVPVSEALMGIAKGMKNLSTATKGVMEAISKRTEKGKKPTHVQVGSLFRNLQADLAKASGESAGKYNAALEKSLGNFIADELTANGYEGTDVKAVSDAIATLTMEGSEALDQDMREAIVNSKAAMDMVKELTTDWAMRNEGTRMKVRDYLDGIGKDAGIVKAFGLVASGKVADTEEMQKARGENSKLYDAQEFLDGLIETEDKSGKVRELAVTGVGDSVLNKKNMATTDEVKSAKGRSRNTARSVIVEGNNTELNKATVSKTGDLQFVTADGRTVSAMDVKTTNEGMSTIINFAQQNTNLFSPEVFNNMVHAFNGTTSQEAVNLIGDVASLYTSAFTNQKMPEKLAISKKLANVVWEQARADYAKAEERRIKRVPGTLGSGKVTLEGINEAELTDEQKESISQLEALGRELKYDFTLYNGDNVDLGSYDTRTGAIRLDITQTDNGANSIMIAATHELTHFIEHHSKTQYAKLRDFVIQSLEAEGLDFNRMVREKMSREGIGSMTYDGAVAEIVAESCENILADSQKIQQMLEHDAELHGTVKGFVQRFVDKVRKALGATGGRTNESRALYSAQKYTEKLAKLWDAALTEAMDSRTGVVMASENEAIKAQDDHTGSISPESGDLAFSIRENKTIGERSQKYFDAHRNQSSHISEEAFKAANDIVNEMAEYMKPFLDSTNKKGMRYLPEEILGKTTFQNGSYGKTIENTTICFRTLAYIDFTNEIKERIGRPLTVEESFLASQMLYDIAKEPQCLYCYVSLDRKAYDGFLLEYTKQRDNVIEKYNALEDKSKANIDTLYEEFLAGRKNTKQMRNRFDLWINTVKNGSRLIDNADLTTEERRSLLKNGTDNAVSKQIIDAEKYAQSASWAKKLEQYRSYNSDILSMSDKMVNTLNAHYGLRFYSFSEYTPAFILENMQQIRDASIKGLYGLAYTKKTDFARIFANTGMNINVSCFGRMDHGQVVPDTYQGADWAEVQQLRKEHKNVGAVFVATNDQMTEWALAQDWIDVVIPFHIVRTGANVAEFYKWTNNTAEQADKSASGKNMTIAPSEFHNDRDTFMRLVQERELTPRFSKWLENPNYMKLVNETRLSDLDSEKLHPDFDLDAAKKSFDTFVEDGGYYGNWYEEGADYEEAVKTVTEDILAGKRANEVEYGRQDFDMSDAKRNRNKRIHGQQHSIRTTKDGTKYVFVDTDQGIFENVKEKDVPRILREYIKNRFRGTVIGSGNVKAFVNARTGSEYTNPAKSRRLNENVYSDKMRAGTELDNMLDAAYNERPGTDDHNEEEFPNGFILYDVVFKVGERLYTGVINIGVDELGRKRFYDLTKIKNIDLATWISQHGGAAVPNEDRYSDEIITSDYESGNTQNSIRAKDSNGKSLSENQQKFFADSKVRDEDGNLRVVYHGTDQNFSVFDMSKGRANMDIQGAFFSPWEEDAGGYGENVKAFYLNITNPASESQGYKALQKFKGQNNAGIKAREYLESLGYDGVNNGDEEYIAFRPEQIKEVGNKNPTNNPDVQKSTRQQVLDVRSYLNSIDAGNMTGLDGDKLRKYQKLYNDMLDAQGRMYDTQVKLAEAQTGSEKTVAKDHADRALKAFNNALGKLQEYEAGQTFSGTLREAQRFAIAVQNVGLTEAQARYANWTKGDLLEQMERLRERETRLNYERKARADIETSHKKIQHNVKWLKDLRMHETDYKNIPEDLKPLADDVVNLFVESDKWGGSIVWSKKDAEKLAEKYERLQYSEMTEDLYSDDVMENLINLKLAMDDLSKAREMGNRENVQPMKLAMMNQAYKHMAEAVKNVRDLIQAQRDAFLGDQKTTISAAAQHVIDPASVRDDYREFKGAFGKKLAGMDRLIRRGNMTPEYFFRNLGNDGLTEANKGFHRGENQYGIDLKEAKDVLDSMREKHGFHDWDGKAKLKFTTEQGREIELTTQQAMSLYATWKRENQEDVVVSKHLENGGFVYSGTEADNKKMTREALFKSGNKISDKDIVQIINFLTDEQKAYVNDVVNYLSTDMGEKGNQTSMKLFGIRKYNEGYYFPIKSFAGNMHQKSDVGTVSGTNDARIKHASFTNSRLNNAQNAILLEDFDSVVANHINQMLTYANMVLPIETMNRILNYKTVTEDGSEQTVRAMIEQKYGTNAVNYLQGYLRDLNGGMTVDNRGDLGKMLSTFKKLAVAGSLSVAFQQPLSYIRASMMVNPKYLAGAINPATYKGSYTEMMKHSGVAVIKDMGKFDMGYGRGAVNWLMDEDQNLYEKFSEKVTILPELMDKATWTRMWTAVKLEQMDQYKDMDHESDEFLDLVGERFNDVMRLTQVYDSVLAKSENMRSKNYGAKVLTSFMAEPTLTANMLYDAYSRFNQKGGKAMIVKASVLFLMSAVAQAAVKAFFGTGRRPDDKKTEEEEFMYKFLQSFYSEANPLGLIPGFSTLTDALSGSDIDDSAWSTITQMGDALTNTAKAIGNGDFSYQTFEESAGLLAQIFTDVPVKNIMRDARAMFNFFTNAPYAKRESSDAVFKYQAQEALVGSDLMNGLNNLLTEAGWGGFKTTNKAYYERIKGAMEAGNQKEADEIREYLSLAKGVSDKSIDSGVKTASGGYKTLWKAIDTNKAADINEAVKYMEKYGYEKKNMASQITSEYKTKYLEAKGSDKVKLKDALIKAYKACGLTDAEATKKINSWK